MDTSEVERKPAVGSKRGASALAPASKRRRGSVDEGGGSDKAHSAVPAPIGLSTSAHSRHGHSLSTARNSECFHPFMCAGIAINHSLCFFHFARVVLAPCVRYLFAPQWILGRWPPLPRRSCASLCSATLCFGAGIPRRLRLPSLPLACPSPEESLPSTKCGRVHPLSCFVNIPSSGCCEALPTV